MLITKERNIDETLNKLTTTKKERKKTASMCLSCNRVDYKRFILSGNNPAVLITDPPP